MAILPFFRFIVNVIEIPTLLKDYSELIKIIFFKRSYICAIIKHYKCVGADGMSKDKIYDFTCARAVSGFDLKESE